MSKLVLDAAPRDVEARKARHLRNDGLVPVIVYGKSQSPVALVVPARSLSSTLQHGGMSQLVEVKVSGGATYNVLVREVQREPVSHRLLHADFYAVRMDEKQHVSVPVVATGKPSAMSAGLMVLQNHESISIEALPADIPAMIEVDLTNLNTDAPIKVSDLPVVKGVTYLDEADEHVFALVTTQAGLEEEAAATEETTAEPEVVKKGKTDEEE